MKKPKVVPKATTKAIAGEINIAMNIATWLAKVNDAGSITILIGENIGMIKPIAISKPAMVIFFIFCVSIINLSHRFDSNYQLAHGRFIHCAFKN